MIRMEDALAKEKLSAQMLLQVHDELIFEVPDDEVEKTLPVVQHGDGRRAAAGGVALGAAAGRGARRRQLGRRALSVITKEGKKMKTLLTVVGIIVLAMGLLWMGQGSGYIAVAGVKLHDQSDPMDLLRRRDRGCWPSPRHRRPAPVAKKPEP
jgi:hypothetical protein